MSATIRRAVEADAREISLIRKVSVAEVCRTHYPADQIARWAGVGSPPHPQTYEQLMRDALVYVAEVDGVLVGFGVLSTERTTLSALYVLPDYLRQGVGSQLFDAMEAEARAAGVTRIVLNATLNAVAFYETCGFVTFCEETHTLSGGLTLRCVRMEKSLSPIPTLTTERLVLRAFEPGDAADVTRLAGAREIAATTLNVPHPYELSDAEGWISGHEELYTAGRGAPFAVVRKDTAELIGTVGLRVSKPHSGAELGYWIGVECWGQGYGTEAAREVVRFAFGTLGLNRVHATCVAANKASARVLEKAGLRYEGLLRQHVRKWGTFLDLKCYGVTRDLWSGTV